MKGRQLLVFCTVLIISASAFASHPAKMTNQYHKSSASKVTKTKCTKALVNINKADVKTLRSVKGIGPKRAAAIISYREKHGAFKNIYELSKLNGHGYSFSHNFIKSIAKKITV